MWALLKRIVLLSLIVPHLLVDAKALKAVVGGCFWGAIGENGRQIRVRALSGQSFHNELLLLESDPHGFAVTFVS
jgi:hypothetical protein